MWLVREKTSEELNSNRGDGTYLDGDIYVYSTLFYIIHIIIGLMIVIPCIIYIIHVVNPNLTISKIPVSHQYSITYDKVNNETIPVEKVKQKNNSCVYYTTDGFPYNVKIVNNTMYKVYKDTNVIETYNFCNIVLLD